MAHASSLAATPASILTFGPKGGGVWILVDAFPAYGLRVSVATDGTLYQTEVYAASRSPAVPSKALSYSRSRLSSSGHSQTSSAHSSGRESVEKGDGKAKEGKKGWSARLVLLLLDIWLGLEGVNPVYHEAIKLLYTFPQSIGITGGRPSSSYYSVGAQDGGLFYFDPRLSRPAEPLTPFVHVRIHTPHRNTGTGTPTPTLTPPNPKPKHMPCPGARCMCAKGHQPQAWIRTWGIAEPRVWVSTGARTRAGANAGRGQTEIAGLYQRLGEQEIAG
ncbi:hypothetical protein B0H14DRAFT_2581634 [Mycena olivaceomarginata]|nr:hypothetical protein B0H14DRAFT_2581634 [Mycena olivaceomarginata]